MPPFGGYDPIGTVQQAITSLLRAQEPAFIAIGTRMFMSFATIILVWHGIRMMLSSRPLGDQMFGFDDLTLTDFKAQSEFDGPIVLLHDAEEADFLRDGIGHINFESRRYSGGSFPKAFAGFHGHGVLDELYVG